MKEIRLSRMSWAAAAIAASATMEFDEPIYYLETLIKRSHS